MEIFNLKNMIKGWFIGNFNPNVFKTDLFEIAIKQYKENEEEAAHFHKVATEYTVVIEGVVEFNGKKYEQNSIVIIKPNEVVKFRSITDSKTVVVKIPSCINDKFEVENVNV